MTSGATSSTVPRAIINPKQPQGLAARSFERGFPGFRLGLCSEARAVACPRKAGLVPGGGEGERVDPGRPGGQVRGGRGDDPGQGQEGGAGLGHSLLHLLQRRRLPLGLGQGHLWS